MAFEVGESPCDNVSKWLALGGESWRLPDATNLDHLEALIKSAMRGGDSLTVEVRCDGMAKRRTLVLNGQALPFVELVERYEGGTDKM